MSLKVSIARLMLIPEYANVYWGTYNAVMQQIMAHYLSEATGDSDDHENMLNNAHDIAHAAGAGSLRHHFNLTNDDRDLSEL